MPDAWTVATALLKAVAYAGALLAMGGVLYVLSFRETEKEVLRATRRLTVIAVQIGLLATIALVPARAGFLGGGSLSAALDPVLLEIVLDSPLATSAAVRVIGLVLVMCLALRGSLWSCIAALGAVATAASFPLVGHGLAEPRWLLAPLIALHLLAVAFWLGALWPLHRAAAGRDQVRAAALMRRFGRVAALAVAVLVAAGLVTALLLLGSVSALWTSDYGVALMVKLALVALLLLLAAGNMWRLVPALEAGLPGGADRLRRAIRLEMVVAGLILLATAWLTRTTSAPALMQQ